MPGKINMRLTNFVCNNLLPKVYANNFRLVSKSQIEIHIIKAFTFLEYTLKDNHYINISEGN